MKATPLPVVSTMNCLDASPPLGIEAVNPACCATSRNWGICAAAIPAQKRATTRFTSYRSLLIARFLSLTSCHSPFVTHLLSLTSYRSLLITHFLSLTSYHSLLITHFLSLTSYHSLLITHFLSLTSYHSLL